VTAFPSLLLLFSSLACGRQMIDVFEFFLLLGA
jgi:hypothetical protein